jgi:RNA polymerase sigma factor (sigma-70 family)
VRVKEITIMTAEAGPIPGHVPVTDLVMRAREGDQRAWDALVERYAPLVWAICRRYRLADADAKDASQAVWLQLVDQIGQIRHPAALPGWLATTTSRECGRLVRAAHRTSPHDRVLDAEDTPDEHSPIAEQELLTTERNAALREALSCLPPRCQQLLALLLHDPPLPYAQISATLGIPVGSIGPSRGRCLNKLRRHPAIAALINTEPKDHPPWAPPRDD